MATVKPTTALCLTALGLALALPGRNARLAFATGLVVVAIAMLDLLDRLGIPLGINDLNRLLVPHVQMPEFETPFHMINGVPIGLTLTGASLALSRFARYHLAAAALVVLVGVMQTYGLLAYLSGAHRFYGSLGTPTPLTGAALLGVCFAIILRIGMMPGLRKPRPLGHLLIMLGCAIIAPLLLLGVYAGIRVTDAQLNEVRNELMSTARTLSAAVDRAIEGEIRTLRALAASPSLQQGDFAEFQRQAEASMASQQSGIIVLVDRNLQQLVNTWMPFGTPLAGVPVRAPVERALTTGKPEITGLFWGPVHQKLTYAIIVPVTVDGTNRYALLGSPDPHILADLVAAKERPPGWQAAVSDAAHRIIVSSDHEHAFIGMELPPTLQRRTAGSDVSECVDSEGRPALAAYTWSELTGWETIVWAPTALLEAPVRALWWTIGLTALTAFALVVTLASWLGRLIARSVGYAARAAVTLGKGGPLPTGETPVAEVDTLMAELRGAAARRQAAEHDLQASRDRLQVAFDASQLGWWQYNPRRRRVSWDARCREILDAAQDEISAEKFLMWVHPDDRERLAAVRRTTLDPANPKPYAYEYRILRSDGKVRWVESHGLAYFEDAGADSRLVSFVGAMQDITERKEREEKENLLMREINHRAKNMLSVVASIANQTASRNPEDFIARFAERIQALSANQDLLISNEWNGVEMADLVRAQLARFARLVGSRISLQGPRLRLNPAAAQAIGLALHELATNAGRHGALSTGQGRIDISWGRSGDTLTISWAEHDGPPVAAPQQRGFGSIVMQAMAERSVAGEVDLDYSSSGVTWRLICPAANALQPE